MLKAVILAGGFGTRISEGGNNIPKPMIEIAGKPIIWHIMKYLSEYGINEFIICLGYKGYIIKEYFVNYYNHSSNVEVNLEKNSINFLLKKKERWKIKLIDTGINTMTGGRLKKVKNFLDNESFLFTYGDGLSNVNINKLLSFNKKQKKLSTITAVYPPGRYGALEISDNLIKKFVEKPKGDVGWINGGYFILEKKCLDFIKGDNTFWENEPLNNLAKKKQLSAFLHKDFWHAMDTIRDKNYLEELWVSGKAPWKIWK